MLRVIVLLNHLVKYTFFVVSVFNLTAKYPMYSEAFFIHKDKHLSRACWMVLI